VNEKEFFLPKNCVISTSRRKDAWVARGRGKTFSKLLWGQIRGGGVVKSFDKPDSHRSLRQNMKGSTGNNKRGVVKVEK